MLAPLVTHLCLKLEQKINGVIHFNVKYKSVKETALLENSDNDMALNLIAINRLRLSDVWGPSFKLHLSLFSSNDRLGLNAKERTHIIYFGPIGDTKIYSWTRCAISVNRPDWHILAGNGETLIRIVWFDYTLLYGSNGVESPGPVPSSTLG